MTDEWQHDSLVASQYHQTVVNIGLVGKKV